MKSFWFSVAVLWASSSIAQLQKLEDLVAIYELNQDEIEVRLGFSCRMRFDFVEDIKEPDPHARVVATEQYVELVQKGDARRADIVFGDLYSEKTTSSKSFRRNDLRLGKKELMVTERGAIERPVSFHAGGFWQPVFDLPRLWPQAVSEVLPLPKPRFIACVELESNGKITLHCLHVSGQYASTFVFDKEVSFLPREISVFSLKDEEKRIEAKDFNGVTESWKKVGVTQIEWQELAGSLYVPKKIFKHNIVPPGEKTLTIHFKDWKIGDDVDKSKLDEAEFRKIDQRTFPFNDLIKAFPEHPPAIVR